MNTRIITIISIIIGAFLASFVISKRMPATSSNGLIVGTASGYAPFVSSNAQGELEGFDIDVAQALAQKMGKELIVKDLGSMTALFTALDQGSIDAIIWGLSITQDRLAKVAMVHYQGTPDQSYPLIFWQKIPNGIASITDMQGLTVCVEPASAQEKVLDRYPAITKLSTEKVDDALFNIQYKKADAALVEPVIAKKFKNKFPEIRILNVPLSAQDRVEGVGIALKQNNRELIEQITNAVQELKSQNTLAGFEKKWGMDS